MPTYDYACQDCDNNFEEFQSITAEPLTNCPECSGAVKRLIGSGNGFLFKGNGFYITDYRSDNYKKDKSKAEGTTSSKTKDKTKTKNKTKAKAKTVA